MAPPTIIAHKSAFLATQTLHLSQTLAPSTSWRASNERAEDGGGLSARAVDDALYRLNHTLTQHARRVYAPQASRHVAEQIEGLFYEEAERALRGDDDDGNGDGDGGDIGMGVERARLRVGADFTTDEAIASLPPTWDVHKPREAEAHPLEARRYAEQTATLTSLSARRQELHKRVERLRRIAALLAPFSPIESQAKDNTNTNHNDNDNDNNDDTTQSTQTPADTRTTSVQENLITRNGEIERELERMRLLLARVAGRIAQLPNKKSAAADGDGEEEAEDFMDLDSLERDKVDKLLDGL
ncbi:kinetochore Sim4 complex subunit Fta4 [Xylaria sp. FL0933]|nr:kinetochore Sim4 complex subunit Fta4 [Xylaria sp. FL0933]